ncbi:MAG: ribosome maturation factor RimP [Candidatus Omnitrophica bacterium]|nr:ribosome maturation factor RimP [Candidatus Omnitrophota bacterium]
MDNEAIINELTNIISTFFNEQGLELVELIYRREATGMVLRVLADRPEGGINVGDCAFLNREISRILDEKNIIEESFLLEVSSPGLDRPLRTKNDFVRCMNRNATFFLNDPVEGKVEWVGKINQVDEATVIIDTKGKVLTIPLSKINKARQEI